jgi:hypothetical protein
MHQGARPRPAEAAFRLAYHLPEANPQALEGERKTVTAPFADITGSIEHNHGQGQLAEVDFREATGLKMNAISWELRAASSLARLLRDTGRRDEGALDAGGDFQWFTGGFDTRDLQEAKQLLDELDQES